MTDVETNAWASLGNFFVRENKSKLNSMCFSLILWFESQETKQTNKKKRRGKWHSYAGFILLIQMHSSECSVAIGIDNLFAAWLRSAEMWQLSAWFETLSYSLAPVTEGQAFNHHSCIMCHLSLSHSSWKRVIPSAFLLSDMYLSSLPYLNKKAGKTGKTNLSRTAWFEIIL